MTYFNPLYRSLAAIACGFALFVLLSAGRANAQSTPDDDARAQRLYQEGADHFTRGEYEDALQRFEGAYVLSRRPQLLFNIGNTADRLRWNRRALHAYRSYLQEVPDASNRAEVERRIEIIQQDAPNAGPPPNAEVVAPPVVVPTPTDTANAGLRNDVRQVPIDTEDEEEGTPFIEEPALWIVIGVLLAGGIVAAVLIATDENDAQGGELLGPDGESSISLLRSAP